MNYILEHNHVEMHGILVEMQYSFMKNEKAYINYISDILQENIRTDVDWCKVGFSNIFGSWFIFVNTINLLQFLSPLY